MTVSWLAKTCMRIILFLQGIRAFDKSGVTRSTATKCIIPVALTHGRACAEKFKAVMA
jgi:hypothetical protein